MSLKHRIASSFSSRKKLEYARHLLDAGKPVQAFAIFSKLAATGDAEACFRVGRAYLDGVGAPPSLEEGSRWIFQAAEAGHVEAAFVLATLYTVGLPEGFEIRGSETGLDLSRQAEPGPRQPDFALGARWARVAADAGLPDAQALLGYILTNGPLELRDLAQARTWYDQSAAAGCSQGHLGVALAILGDARTGEELSEAARHLEEATKGGLGTAYSLLARLYQSGAGVPRDLARAARLFREAAERNVIYAQAAYGLALLEGNGVERHFGRAETWLKRAALGGDTQSAALLGDLCANGGDLPPNLVEAAKWYRLAAEQKHAGAARALGLLYLTGNGVHQDPDVATHWFKIAAENGDAKADADFGNLILAGASASEQEKMALRDRFEKAAERGDLVGAYNLGVCFAEGVAGNSDQREAARWLQKAADGIVNAQYWYGRMLLDGRGVQVDPTQALHWMELAADAGMAEAQVAVAGLLVSGAVNGRRDHDKALMLYRDAAEGGNVDAMFSLAAMYGGGHDIPEDRTEARKWFRKAAQRGSGLAQLMLGRYLLRGLGGAADPVEARLWLERARERDVAEAADELTRLNEAEPDDDD